MSHEYSDSSWAYTVEPDKPDLPLSTIEVIPVVGRDRSWSSFKGLPLPEKELIEILGIEEVEKIDSYLKEMIHWKEVLYGKDSKHVGFHSGNIIFKHKTNPNIEIDCSSKTSFEYNPELVKEFSFFPERHNSVDNYLVRFSIRVKELIEAGQEIL